MRTCKCSERLSVHTDMYRIAGNFWRRKLSWIGEKYDFRRENFRGRHAPNFAEKTFAYSHKTVKFAQVFSLESFPLYSTSAQSCEGLLPACSVGMKGTGSEDDSCWMHFQHESSFSTHDNLLSYGYAMSLTIMQQGNLRVKAGSWM